MTSEDARLAARRSVGGLEQVKEAYRDRRSIPFVEAVNQDLRHAGRGRSGEIPGLQPWPS